VIDLVSEEPQLEELFFHYYTGDETMLRDIWTKTLWDQRRTLLGWAIGFAAVSLVYGGFYPFAATPEYSELIDSLPPGLAEAFGWGDISSPHGYLGSTVFGILGPVLAIVMAIGLGARAIAGSEEDGSLELLIAHPVSRTRVVLQKTAALGPRRHRCGHRRVPGDPGHSRTNRPRPARRQSPPLPSTWR
jgi:hypothetical protein